jgi:hypothetical protein
LTKQADSLPPRERDRSVLSERDYANALACDPAIALLVKAIFDPEAMADDAEYQAARFKETKAKVVLDRLANLEDEIPLHI